VWIVLWREAWVSSIVDEISFREWKIELDPRYSGKNGSIKISFQDHRCRMQWLKRCARPSPQLRCLGRLFFSDVIRRHPHSKTTHTQSYSHHGQRSSDTFTLGTASFVIRICNFFFTKDKCVETLVRRSNSRCK
jgi:hypothetical protein